MQIAKLMKEYVPVVKYVFDDNIKSRYAWRDLIVFILHNNKHIIFSVGTAFKLVPPL